MNSLLERAIFDCGKAAAIAVTMERAFICQPDGSNVKNREEAEYVFYALLDAVNAVQKDLDQMAKEIASE